MNVLPQIPESFTVPESFRATHVTYPQLMQLLGLDEADEWEFWQRYKAGLIPSGVWLPASSPMVCWNREFIDSWMALGCPAQPGVLAHHKLVYDALLKAVSEENPQASALMFAEPESN